MAKRRLAVEDQKYYNPSRMKLTVIIPAYNEARTIEQCLTAVYDRNPGLDLEVIVLT